LLQISSKLHGFEVFQRAKSLPWCQTVSKPVELEQKDLNWAMIELPHAL
jgi:hypothetical protein